MAPRITISRSEEQPIETWRSEARCDRLVEAPEQLDRRGDHIHLAPEGTQGEIALSEQPYRTTDKVLAWGKTP